MLATVLYQVPQMTASWSVRDFLALTTSCKFEESWTEARWYEFILAHFGPAGLNHDLSCSSLPPCSSWRQRYAQLCRLVPRNEQEAEEAVVQGHLHLLKYARKYRQVLPPTYPRPSTPSRPTRIAIGYNDPVITEAERYLCAIKYSAQRRLLNNLPLVLWLQKHGCFDYRDCLSLAVRFRYWETVSWLLSLPEGPLLVDWLAMKWAIAENRGDLLAQMHQLNPQVRLNNQQTIQAVHSGSIELLQYLQAEGVPLHSELMNIACLNNQINMANYLLTQGLHPTSLNADDIFRSIEMFQWILNQGVLPTRAGVDGACLWHCWTTVRLALIAGVYPTEYQSYDLMAQHAPHCYYILANKGHLPAEMITMLNRLVYRAHFRVVKFFLRRNLKPPPLVWNVLRFTGTHVSGKMRRLLLNHGVYPEQSTIDCCVHESRDDMVKLFLEYRLLPTMNDPRVVRPWRTDVQTRDQSRRVPDHIIDEMKLYSAQKLATLALLVPYGYSPSSAMLLEFVRKYPAPIDANILDHLYRCGFRLNADNTRALVQTGKTNLIRVLVRYGYIPTLVDVALAADNPSLSALYASHR